MAVNNNLTLWSLTDDSHLGDKGTVAKAFGLEILQVLH